MDATWDDHERQTSAAGEAGRVAYARYRHLVARPEWQASPPALDALARRAHAGDRTARDELHRTLEPWLQILARPALRAAHTCPSARITTADVSQQIFPLFCDLLRDWQPARAPFPVYLGAVLPHRLRHFVRRARRPLEITGVLTPPGVDPASGDEGESPAERALGLAPDPADCYSDGKLQAQLLTALDSRARRLVQLHILEGRPMPEVAATLGISLRAAWRLRSAALATLRSELAHIGIS